MSYNKLCSVKSATENLFGLVGQRASEVSLRRPASSLFRSRLSLSNPPVQQEEGMPKAQDSDLYDGKIHIQSI